MSDFSSCFLRELSKHGTTDVRSERSAEPQKVPTSAIEESNQAQDPNPARSRGREKYIPRAW